MIINYQWSPGWNLHENIQSQINLALQEFNVIITTIFQTIEQHETAWCVIRLLSIQRCQHPLPGGE
jgi:hypothetical protein